MSRQATSASQTPSLSPAELSYLHSSLAQPNAPIRPDGRSATQFRPLTAEPDILPGANGSARIGFADGTQAIVGVKAEVERSVDVQGQEHQGHDVSSGNGNGGQEEGLASGNEGGGGGGGGQSSWVQMSIEIPGFRDDDALPVFLAEMMREPLVGSVHGNTLKSGLKGRLVINRRWHWRLYIDVLLLSQPLSYPLPLLSLTTHLALLSTKLPKLKSQGEEDPFFDDDWGVAEFLYPRSKALPLQLVRPPVTLLVIAVEDNIIFDPTREEIAVADTVLAVSVARDSDSDNALKLLSIRTVDPPSRLTQPGAAEDSLLNQTADQGETPGVWKPRRGGVKRTTIARIVKMVIKKGGVGEEVLEGLEGVDSF